jgi:hypothetical protein
MTNDEINERIDKMGQWANGVNEQIKTIGALISGLLAIDDIEQNQLIQDMTELEKRLTEGPSIKRVVSLDLVALRQRITAAEANQDDIEANLYLNVCAELDDDGKKPIYTNESQRKAALKLAKKHSDEYQSALTDLGQLEADKARLDAQLAEVCESNRIDIRLYAGCVARLENFTARITINGKEL